MAKILTVMSGKRTKGVLSMDEFRSENRTNWSLTARVTTTTN